ncbi:MAG: hypothetical protein NTW28_32865 [Candidatus Solibacter sp.]|nr:hypothetical protein [Candidatus Solibacter sp.]
MTKFMLWVALAALSGDALLAQDLTGAWQGTLQLPGGRELRMVIKVSKAEGSGLRAIMYSIDQGGQGIPANPVTLQGSTVKRSRRRLDQGKLEAGTRPAGFESKACHRPNRLGDSRTSAAAEADGRGCNSGV